MWGHASAENIKEEGWDPEAVRNAYEYLGARLSHNDINGPIKMAAHKAWEEVGLGPDRGITPEHVVTAPSTHLSLFLQFQPLA